MQKRRSKDTMKQRIIFFNKVIKKKVTHETWVTFLRILTKNLVSCVLT